MGVLTGIYGVLLQSADGVLCRIKRHKVYAATPTEQKWEFVGDEVVHRQWDDGTIYVGSRDNKVYALNPDGTKKWEFVRDNKSFFTYHWLRWNNLCWI